MAKRTKYRQRKRENIANKPALAFYVSCHRDTARICCWAPCCGAAAAEHRRLLRAMQQSIDISCPPGAQQQTRTSGVQPANSGTDRQTDRQTDGRTDGRPTVTQTLLRKLCKQCQQYVKITINIFFFKKRQLIVISKKIISMTMMQHAVTTNTRMTTDDNNKTAQVI